MVVLLPFCYGDQVSLYFIFCHRSVGDDEEEGRWRRIKPKPHQPFNQRKGVSNSTLRFVSLSLPELGCFFRDHTHLQLSGLKVHVEDG